MCYITQRIVVYYSIEYLYIIQLMGAKNNYSLYYVNKNFNCNNIITLGCDFYLRDIEFYFIFTIFSKKSQNF